MPEPLVSLIVAMAHDRAIGKGNALLWRLPGDLQHFRKTTTGAPVIMGRKTFDSIGRPLPNRRNVVVTRQTGWSAAGVEAAGSLDEALALVGGTPKAYVIGGAQIYAEALGQADELIVTEVDGEFDADAFFPEWDRGRFEEVSRSETFQENGLTYRFVTYFAKPASKAERNVASNR